MMYIRGIYNISQILILYRELNVIVVSRYWENTVAIYPVFTHICE